MSEYRKIFSEKTFKKLHQKSIKSFETMLGGKNLFTASIRTQELLGLLVDAEGGKRDYLETLAKEIIYELYPIVKEADIVLDISLGPQDFSLSQDKEEKEDEAEDDLQTSTPLTSIEKRRIVNAITQGASIRGSKSFLMFRDILDAINEDLYESYKEITNLAYGIYDDDNAIAMMLAMVAQQRSSQGGESEAEYNEESGTLTIKARGIVFPILLQEIIKGLYEIISLQGFSGDKEENRRVVQSVDKVINEPEDIRFGKFIYDKLTELVLQEKMKYKGFLEYFLIEVYKQPDREFKVFIENMLNDELTYSQEDWVNDIKQSIIKQHYK